MPSIIHIYLPNMTHYTSNNWQIQSMATISHKSLTSQQTHKFILLNPTCLKVTSITQLSPHKPDKKVRQKKTKATKDKNIRKKNNRRQSKTKGRRKWLAVFAAFYCSWYTEETSRNHSLESLHAGAIKWQFKLSVIQCDHYTFFSFRG